jgi:FlaG/FlaF family flagellin (archaellin)
MKKVLFVLFVVILAGTILDVSIVVAFEAWIASFLRPLFQLMG